MRGHRSRSTSWDGAHRDVSWNRSPNRAANEDGEPSWTPPIGSRPTENLTVILKNKDTSKRKREKKKKAEKRRRDSSPSTRKEKRKQRNENTPQPSKEVFASGDNILVSVSFNKDKPHSPAQQTTIVTLPPSKDQIVSKKQSERDGGAKRARRNTHDTKAGPRKHKKIDIKPVAIIDLDNSPFKEMTPSPKAVIVLSDSENENDKVASGNSKSTSNYGHENSARPASTSRQATAANTTKRRSNYIDLVETTEATPQTNNKRDSNVRVASQPQSPSTDAPSFEISSGPKTPPEPHLIKFSIKPHHPPLHWTMSPQGTASAVQGTREGGDRRYNAHHNGDRRSQTQHRAHPHDDNSFRSDRSWPRKYSQQQPPPASQSQENSNNALPKQSRVNYTEANAELALKATPNDNTQQHVATCSNDAVGSGNQDDDDVAKAENDVTSPTQQLQDNNTQDNTYSATRQGLTRARPGTTSDNAQQHSVAFDGDAAVGSDNNDLDNSTTTVITNCYLL